MKSLICSISLLLVFSSTVFSQFTGWNPISGRNRYMDSMANNKLKNNAAGDSTLSTDINGKFKNTLKGTRQTFTGIDSITINGNILCQWSSRPVR